MNKQLIIPLCLLIACTQSQPQQQPSVAASPQAQTLAYNNATSPEAIARQITVRVLVGDRRSSGTIIARQGNRYTILTNAHVTNKGNNYRITTPDGKTYPAKCAQPLKQGLCIADKNHDLALLEFTSSQTYTVPTWGDSQMLTPGKTIYSAGFPFDEQNLKIAAGKFNIQTDKPLLGGYQIGFNTTTAPGMSGGSLLNSKGQLIGIIGFSSYPILNDGYQYQDGSKSAAGDITQWRKSSFAIPVATLATIDRQYAALLPKNGGTTVNTVANTKSKYGVVKTVDDIAEQITVRVETREDLKDPTVAGRIVSKQANGSGVIIAKQGDTYYVATAAHVVKGQDGVTIVTPTQERVVVKQISIPEKGTDVAIIKFRSNQQYRIAKLGLDRFRDDNSSFTFVSGFPAREVSKKRYLSFGGVLSGRKQMIKELFAKDSSSLGQGYGLIYSNPSFPGMSGGPVLDRQGRLVGINNGVENERELTGDGEYSEISFGYSLGVPSSTLLRIAKAELPSLSMDLNPLSELLDKEWSSIRAQFPKPSLPSQTASGEEWLNYANQAWQQGGLGIDEAYVQAIKLLESTTPPDKRLLGLAYYGRGNYQKWGGSFNNLIVPLFQKATVVSPEFMPAWRDLAFQLQTENKNTEALNAIQKAIALKPENSSLYFVKALIENNLSRYSDMIKSCESGLNIQPSNSILLLARGSAYATQNQYSQALSDFSKAIQVDPQNEIIYATRGTMYIKREQYSQAITDFSKAIQIDSQYVLAYEYRGAIYDNQKQYPQALADYSKAIQLNTQNVKIYNRRAFIYLSQKQYSEAITDYSRAIELDPKGAEAYSIRGAIYHDQRQYLQALVDYKKAAELYLSQNNTVNYQKVMEMLQKLKPVALADYSNALQVDPQNIQAYENRGAIYDVEKQYPQALADYSRAIQLSTKNVLTYNRRGFIYTSQKQYPQAIADYNKVIQIDPNNAEAYFMRGTIYTDQKQYPQALVDCRKASKLYLAQNNADGRVGFQKVMELLKKLRLVMHGNMK
jgi:tetratricopeptide (TPR) repeat protein/S1-C subfamily serine protease